MKINKVIFSCSEEYSDFWNFNSKIFKKYLNIHPVCLLFGDKNNCNLSTKYGDIIEMEYMEDLPKIIQLTWSKFHFTSTEKDTTWMIGDIDQIPLQKDYFIKNISNIDSDAYVHLNAAYPTWREKSIRYGGADLPAHYHTAKGETFDRVLNLDISFREHIEHIVNNNNEYGLKIHDRSLPIEKGLWCAEETRSSDLIRDSLNDIKFNEFRVNGRRICRSNMRAGQYVFDREKLKKGEYIDLHCDRPFKKTEDQINDIINIAFSL